jgi:hypothetical protein
MKIYSKKLIFNNYICIQNLFVCDTRKRKRNENNKTKIRFMEVWNVSGVKLYKFN